MLHPRHRHPEAMTTAVALNRSRHAGVAIVSMLMLTLTACSPGQDSAPEPGQEDDTAVTETEASPTETQDSSPAQGSSQDEPDEQAEPETNDDAASASPPEPTSQDDQADQGDQGDDVADAAAPESFEISSIGAGSELMHLGLREDNTLDVPPGDPGSPASWYTGSPAPGDPGPAVLLGHVDDSLGEPGVFADLPALVEGDEITIDREDGTTATFEVTKAEQYYQDTFPTLEVYGNTEDPELRLITCDGYNQATGEYEDNYVVYATLVS
ncbi:class F sortase [Nesterenkonia aurantiaca]|uniref:class F sortase n=1 Tax=Nesterenkonia aurantiaca TaxID=1436010 RepID=UPI003EE78874